MPTDAFSLQPSRHCLKRQFASFFLSEINGFLYFIVNVMVYVSRLKSEGVARISKSMDSSRKCLASLKEIGGFLTDNNEFLRELNASIK